MNKIASSTNRRSKYTWRLTSTETIRIIRDGKKGRGGGMEVGEERDYIPIVTVITRMIPALRWAAMRAILMFQ